MSPVATSTMSSEEPAGRPEPAVNETDVFTAPPFDSAWIRDGVVASPGLRFSCRIEPPVSSTEAVTARVTSLPTAELARMSPSTTSLSNPAVASTCTESAPPPGLVATSEV